jgi:hypothetical protein
MRKTLLVAASAATLTLGLATPAMAATTGDTTVNFTLTGGLLSVTVPASATLGSALTGGVATPSGALGVVTVADGRGGVAAWTATVTTTSFTSAENIGLPVLPAGVSYAPGSPTASTGIAIFTPGIAGAIGATKAAIVTTGVSGNNSLSWNPTITVAVPASAIVGTYSGTITHSVA